MGENMKNLGKSKGKKSNARNKQHNASDESSLSSSSSLSYYQQKIHYLSINNKALKHALRMSHNTISHQDKLISELDQKLISQVPQLTYMKLQEMKQMLRRLSDLVDEIMVINTSNPFQVMNDITCDNISPQQSNDTRNENSERSVCTRSNQNYSTEFANYSRNSSPDIILDDGDDDSFVSTRLARSRRNKIKPTLSKQRAVSKQNSFQSLPEITQNCTENSINEGTGTTVPNIMPNSNDKILENTTSNFNTGVKAVKTEVSSGNNDDSLSECESESVWEPKIRIKLPVKRSSNTLHSSAQKRAKLNNSVSKKVKSKKKVVSSTSVPETAIISLNKSNEEEVEVLSPKTESKIVQNKLPSKKKKNPSKSSKSKVQSKKALNKKKKIKKEVSTNKTNYEHLAVPSCSGYVPPKVKVKETPETTDKPAIHNINKINNIIENTVNNHLNGDVQNVSGCQDSVLPNRCVRTPSVEIVSQPQVVLLDIFTTSSLKTSDPLISKSKEKYLNSLKKENTVISNCQPDLDLDVFCEDDILTNVEPEVNDDESEKSLEKQTENSDEVGNGPLPVAEEWTEVLNFFTETQL